MTQTFRVELDDGHHIVGDEHPGERPAYVFLHGLGSVRCGEKSATLLEHATRRGRAFARFDMRGHGASSGQLGQIKVSALIEDAIRVLERIGPAYLVGSSLGGLVASHAAAARPDLVRKLTLLAPAFGLMPQIDRHLDANGCLATDEGLSFHVAEHVVEDAKQLDERALPSRINSSTLVVHGTADEVIPTAVSTWFHQELQCANKALWIVDGGDHRLNNVATDIWRRMDELPD